ncbi:unnamed protein product [Phaeothamnion confervicola]
MVQFPSTSARFSLLLLVAALLGVAQAFVAPKAAFSGVQLRTPARAQSESWRGHVAYYDSTYWEGKAPPSKVLGPVVSKVPGPALGILSLVAFSVGTYCVHESNIFHSLTADTVYPQYVIGSLLTPVSWGLHVAAWIQKQNGK